MAKIIELRVLELEWHFIGALQANKTRMVAEAFDWVHSVDRLEIAQRLSDQRPASLPPLSICLQVNVSGEASKGGVLLTAALKTGACVGGAAETSSAWSNGHSGAAP